MRDSTGGCSAAREMSHAEVASSPIDDAAASVPAAPAAVSRHPFRRRPRRAAGAGDDGPGTGAGDDGPGTGAGDDGPGTGAGDDGPGTGAGDDGPGTGPRRRGTGSPDGAVDRISRAVIIGM